MMEGFVNADHQAWLRLTIKGNESHEATVEALIDTGFGGFLALPAELIAELGFMWLGREEGVLADDSVELFDVYRGTIEWDGEPRLAEVIALTASALVGMGLLVGHSLRIEVMPDGAVVIAPLRNGNT